MPPKRCHDYELWGDAEFTAMLKVCLILKYANNRYKVDK